MTRGEFVRRWNDLVAAVSDSSKEDARHFMYHLVSSVLAAEDREAWTRRLADELLCAWYDTYKSGGRGPWLPRESAGIARKAPE